MVSPSNHVHAWRIDCNGMLRAMIKGLLAIAAAFFLIKYREKIVELTGKFAWAEKYLGSGGTYNLMVILAIIFFFWGIAAVTGTTHLFLAPIMGIFSMGGM